MKESSFVLAVCVGILFFAFFISAVLYDPDGNIKHPEEEDDDDDKRNDA